MIGAQPVLLTVPQSRIHRPPFGKMRGVAPLICVAAWEPGQQAHGGPGRPGRMKPVYFQP